MLDKIYYPEIDLHRIAEAQVITGTTDIDDSAQTETTPFSILEIAPAAGAPLHDCEVWLDLAKATTGFAAVETSITVQFAVARKVDGTNWRREAYAEAALSGTNAAGRMAKLDLGTVTEAEGACIYAVMSADASSDIELPFARRAAKTRAETRKRRNSANGQSAQEHAA